MIRQHARLFVSILFVIGVVAPAAAGELTAWDLVYQARIAAEKDDHRTAINLYLAAVD